jgi:hypothetical protein
MSRLRIAIGCAALASTALGLWAWRQENRSAPVAIAPRYHTAWTEHGVLYMRYESDAHDTLLLKHLTTSEHRDLIYSAAGHPPQRPSETNPRPVYRFTPTAKSLTQAEEGAWQRASGTVIDCGLPSIPRSPFRVDYRTDALKYGGAVVPTRGRAVQSVEDSPDGRWAAVLSVDGTRFPTLMPFLGRGRVEGIRYHQVFSVANGTQVGETVALPFDSTFDTFGACWAPDSRYVVYPETSFRFLAILEGPPTASKETGP